MQVMYNFIEDNLFWLLVFPYIIAGILVLLIILYRKDKTHSISRFVASSSVLSRFFAVFLTLGSIPLYLTLAFYLIPKYSVNLAVVLCVFLIYTCQTILAFFPDKEGRTSSIHKLFAYLGGFCTILFCLLMFLLGVMPFELKLLLIQFIIINVILLSLLMFTKHIKRYIFIIELIFIIDWVITIFSLAFIK